MAADQESIISCDVLRWAREQRGMSIGLAAKRLQISEDRLLEIESGTRQPTMAQLRNMSDKYKRPLIVLLLDEPPTTFTPLRDFRLLPTGETGVFSPELLDEIKRADQQQEIFAELKGDMGELLLRPKLPIGTKDQIVLAAGIRKLLGVTYEQQKKWTDPRVAFTEWRQRIESLGILILEASRVPMSEMRGLSLSSHLPLVIVLNGLDSPRGKIFTMLHELTHLCLRDPGVCDLHPSRRGTADVEIFCNAVAGETLLPTATLEALSVVQEHVASSLWSDAEIESIASVCGGASHDVILRRLLDLGRLSRPEFESRRKVLQEAYEEFRKNRSRKKDGGGPPPYRMQLRDRGRPFICSVFDAYAEGHINLSEVVDLAGVRTKHLANMQREAYA
jgi:Zn-dependent peptidase ImmA (M78 family)/transcriptional regulator with XRE-family HTH domain